MLLVPCQADSRCWGNFSPIPICLPIYPPFAQPCRNSPLGSWSDVLGSKGENVWLSEPQQIFSVLMPSLYYYITQQCPGTSLTWKREALTKI